MLLVITYGIIIINSCLLIWYNYSSNNRRVTIKTYFESQKIAPTNKTMKQIENFHENGHLNVD